MRNILIAILLFFCVSCTTTKMVEVPIETVRTEYIKQVETKYDSIFVRDSIDRYMKGDTVFIEKYRDRYKYRDRTVTDTICKTDSIQVPIHIETIKEVNKIKWYQNLLMYCGVGFLAIFAFSIVKSVKNLLGKN